MAGGEYSVHGEWMVGSTVCMVSGWWGVQCAWSVAGGEYSVHGEWLVGSTVCMVSGWWGVQCAW